MKPIYVFTAAMLLMPARGFSAEKELTARAWLGKVPPLPVDANTAYGQWVDDGNGGLTPGAGFKEVEDGINESMVHRPGGGADAEEADEAQDAQRQMAAAQQMQAEYGSPEGQAKLRSMSPAELMALAQRMQPQAMAPQVINEHDQALIQKIGVSPGTAAVAQDGMKAQLALNAVTQNWAAADQAINARLDSALRALPVCPGEAGVPSAAATRETKLRFAGEHIQMAAQYLGQMQPLIQQLTVAVGPEIDFGDEARRAWAHLEDKSLKHHLAPEAHGAERIAKGDVLRVQQAIEAASRQAAMAVAAQKVLERLPAGGC